MCGFVGIINKDKKTVNSHLLESMASVIHHRGPDEEGLFIDGAVGFYHKRLSIIDLKTGRQPMTYSDCTIVYNGEIYNYIELRDNLKKRGHQFKTSSDTEVILHLYEEYGDVFINDLNGMFAFIIYDKLSNRLLIAKDHFGIKPLYWYHDEKKIVFGNEIKAILKHPDIFAAPDRKNLYEYLKFLFILGEETMFRNIFKVLPAHYMIIDLAFGKLNKYRETDFKIDRYQTEDYFIARVLVKRIHYEDSWDKEFAHKSSPYGNT